MIAAHPATKWRQVVAMGISPLKMGQPREVSPNGQRREKFSLSN